MKNSKIKTIKAREILNSCGEPTVEAEVETDTGIFFASVPSGTSKGKLEAKELRDGGKRYSGKGVLKAVKNIEKIIGPKLKGKDPIKQKEIDEMMRKLDGTEDKSKLGANSILAVSIAVCRAGAAAKDISLYQHISQLRGLRDPTSGLQTRGRVSWKLPKPCLLLIEGGVHAGNNLDFQEFMLVPQENSFSKNLQAGSEIYHTLGLILEKKYGKSATNVGLEGGFAPPLRFPEQALDLIMEAKERAGYKDKANIILDCAASEFYKNGKYKMKQGVFTRDGLLNYYSNLIQKYPIIGIEDPFSQNDWQGFKEITKASGSPSSLKLIIGDDLTVTNIKQIRQAKNKQSCNGIIIKPNQIGTVSETIDAAKLARENNWQIFVKHRSKETNDDFIAHLSAGLNADGIMAGAPCRGERLAKYNRLLKIELEI